jgi:hypothetical protein
MRIIVDTNIWYEISENVKLYKAVNQLPVYLTAWNILELISSPKLNGTDLERKKIFKVFNDILYLKPECIPLIPYQYIAKEVLESKGVYKELSISAIENLICGYYSDEKIKQFIELRKEGVRAFKKSMDEQQNQLAEEFRKAKMVLGIEHIYLKTIQESKGYLIPPNEVISIDLSKNANRIMFFLKVRLAISLKLHSSKTQVAKNDQGDLLNMVYVNEGDKYLSYDDKWLRKIQFDGLEDFLFTLPR